MGKSMPTIQEEKSEEISTADRQEKEILKEDVDSDNSDDESDSSSDSDSSSSSSSSDSESDNDEDFVRDEVGMERLAQAPLTISQPKLDLSKLAKINPHRPLIKFNRNRES